MAEWQKAAPTAFRRPETVTYFLRHSGLVPYDLAQTAPRVDVNIPERLTGRTIPLPSPLPADAADLTMSLGELLARRRSRWPRADASPLDIPGVLARVFGASSIGPEDRHPHRSYPSASRAYAVHPYVYIPAIGEAVIGRYDPRHHELQEVRETTIAKLDALTPQTRFGYRSFGGVAAVVFLVGNVTAMHGRYGALAPRVLLLEAGHIGAVLQLVCAAQNADAMPFGGFYDEHVASELGLDEGQHCLYVWAIG